ncbi:hypothetical protein ACQPU1_01235 [Clostridium paraputrificum]|uniref:hypothetical protein n=1 Tax=Clostridium paraputrificum TaxID=29363 RepID=UPI003D339D1C
MGLFNKTKEKQKEDALKILSKTKVLTNVIDGLPVSSKADINITCDGTQIIIQEVKLKFTKNEVLNTFRINLENILDLIVADKKEILNKNKSVIGRGVAGGLIFGPVGAMLGGMSGIGGKQEIKKIGTFLVISYRNSAGEIANITLKADKPMTGMMAKDFVKNVKKLLLDIKGGNGVIGNDIEL